jgi:hypothetical protein
MHGDGHALFGLKLLEAVNPQAREDNAVNVSLVVHLYPNAHDTSDTSLLVAFAALEASIH